MPLDVVAVITAKPGSEDVVQQALEELATTTRTEEGCIAYAVHRSVADGTVFVTVEQWRESADLDAHLQAPHLQHALAVTGEHLAAPPAIHPLQPVSV